MQKARRHIINDAPTACKRMVSGTISLFFRSSFHLSLTVLVHYRSLSSIQPYRMVPAGSHRISRVPCYSGYLLKTRFLRVQDYHLLWSSFPKYFHFFLSVFVIQVLQHHYCLDNNGLGCSRFDRLYSGNHYCFLFLRLLRCFSSPGLLSETSSE